MTKKESGHSCPPGGLENPPSVVGDGQGLEGDFGEGRGMSELVPVEVVWNPHMSTA